jgi:hypothetical protein
MINAIVRFVLFLLAVVFLAGAFAGKDGVRLALTTLNAAGAVVGALVAWVTRRRRGSRLTRQAGAGGMVIGALLFGLSPVVLALVGGAPSARIAELLGEALAISLINGVGFSLFAFALFASATRSAERPRGPLPG